MAWALTAEERRRAEWERRGLVELGNAFLVATCATCEIQDEVYTLDAEAAVVELLAAKWAFEERGARPWVWFCVDH